MRKLSARFINETFTQVQRSFTITETQQPKKRYHGGTWRF
jgi:hypothetical protein